MIVVESVADLREAINHLHRQGKRIAFVPTMGNLHAGHLALMQTAREQADAVVVSIFVNPLQFPDGEDLASYPRTPDADQIALEQEQIDLLFLPAEATIYPRPLDQQTRVTVPGVSDILCGASRPGHFQGVTTVVNRLFNLVQPDIAVFGKKDYQQLLLIRLMVVDLGIPVEIIAADTVREQDGLAMSSRNNYLTKEECQFAPGIYAVLKNMAQELVAKKEVPDDIETRAYHALEERGLRPEYVSIRRQQDLAEPRPGDTGLVILAAAWLGKTRLIDNLEVELNPGG